MSEIQNINHLARDRELKTLELHQPNDFYGHATILKKNVGIQNNYQLKTAIEHGVYLKPEGWDVDLKSPLPSMFTFSSFRHRHLKKITDKSLYAIGPYVQYAKPFLNIMESNEQRRRLGNCLLVFPAHSTHWVDVEYNIHKYCQNIETIGKSFNSIRICLYWKDILRGTAKIYGQHGFECVTAGHMYDPQFLPRLKSIIESATMTTSNQISTVIGYCITMGKPHFLMESEVELSSIEKKFLDECTNFNQNIFVEEIRKAFKIDLQDEISPDQFAAVEKYWGLGEEKTRDELIEILEEAEDLYRKKAISPLMNMKSGASIDSYEGSWGEVLGKIASKVDKIPRRLPGEIRINNTRIHYVDFHSFYHQANQIFRYDLYGFKCQVDEPLIIDCGAHIGLASIYFAQCFPGAKIMAFEADPTIVKVLEKNIDAFGYKNIKTYPQAIWTNFDGIAFKNSGDDSGYISEQGNEDCIKIPTTRLRDILKENKIDLLKLDIEGAEYEVIRDCDEYLKNVDRIIVEIHKFKDEKVSIGNIFSILEKNNFEYALGDLHSAIWLETSMIQPFKALKTDKFIITVYAWRVDDGCGMDNHSKASNIKYSSVVEMGDSDRLPNMVYKCHGIDKIWQIADHQITGGAAIAGHRLFAGLKSANANVKLIPFNDPTISETCCNSLMQTYNRDQFRSNKMSSMSGSPSRNNWIDLVSGALNTDTPQIINIHNIHEAIHYHGVPFGVLDLMAKKARLVFTLHDMWLLTGRCAYNGDCQRFVDQSCNETCPTPTIYPNALPGEISALLRTKMDFFKGNPDAVIVTPSSWLALQARKSHLKDHRIEVIPYGIDTSVFRPDDDRDGLRRSIGIPPNACVMLISAANLSDPRKGADLLLKALSNTKDELLVLTVGKTDIQPDLPDNIKFYNYGFVTSPEEMAFAYSVADLFICPSLEDNLPCVLIESISCGTPCIGFNVGGVPEVIRPGKTGWLAPEATPESLSKLITDLHKKPGIISDLRPSCREVAKQEYALNIQAERYLKLYQELIGQEADMPPRANVQKKDRENNLQSDYEVIQKYIENGEIESAKVRLEKLVEINPDFATGHNDLGVLAYREGLKDEAFKHYAAAVKLQPENIIFLKNLADYYYVELGKIEEALKLYVKVLQNEPNDIETLMVVGHLCIAIEKFSEAKNFYEKILEIDSHNEEAKVFIEKLNTKCREIERKQNDEEKPIVDNSIKLNDINSNKYLVSAIVSTYNAEKFIRGCLEDLENQTIADRLEIVVVNSGSNENEEAIVREFQKKFKNIKYIRTANRENVYAAWNRAIKVATGKYITNANTDDRHRKDAYEIMVKTLEKHPEVSLVYADVIITETHNETFEKCTPIGTFKWLNWNRDDLLHKGCFMGPQPMWRRNVHVEYGYFDETFITSGDYEFWLRISQTRKFLHIPEFLGLYLRRHGSIEHSNSDKQYLENQRILEAYRAAEKPGEIIRSLNDSQKTIVSSKNISSADSLKYKNKDIRVSIILFERTGNGKIKNCLDAILENTNENYEIIFVKQDRGNKSKILLNKLARKKIPVKIIPIKKGLNNFALINRGIDISIGQFIVLVSSEVTVFKGWLSGMLDCANRHQNSGIVGPMTNLAACEKQIISDCYEIPLNRTEFAASFLERNHHRRINTDWVDGTCMLFNRHLIDQIGFFDESLNDELSNTKDLCLRAAMAGYENLIAGDIFVHRQAINKSLCSLFDYKKKWLGIDCQSETGKKYAALTHIRNGNVNYEQGRFNSAVKSYLKSIERTPDNANIYFKFIETLIDAKEYKDALDVLEEIPPETVDDRKTEFMAYCYEGLNEIEKAKELINKRISNELPSPAILNLKGLIAYKEENPKLAKDYFKQAIALDPGFGEPYSNLGVTMLEETLEEALQLIEKAFILTPTVSDIISNTHNVLKNLKEYDKGERLFREASKIHPDNKQLRFKLIDFLLGRENRTEAMHEIEEAITRFGLDDGILLAALKVRDIIGPIRIDRETVKNPTVSLCMIVKNEEKFLAKCLHSIKPIVDEMIIVDTGSEDRTKEIAAVFGGRVFDFEWRSDFAEARNFSLSKAKGEWILIMDADEKISPQDYEYFRKLVAKKPSGLMAYSIITRNYCNMANTIGWIPNSGQYISEEAGLGWLSSEKVRLFSNSSQIKFEGVVHEMVDPILKRLSVDIRKCHIAVHHYGRLDGGKLVRKDQAYYEIGRKKLLKNGGDIGTVRELAIQATVLERNSEAIELWQKFLSMEPGEAAVADAYVNMVSAYIRMHDYSNAHRLARKAVSLNPQMKEAQYNLGITELYRGNVEAAFNTLKKLRKSHPDFPPAQFLLVASNYCMNSKADVNRNINKLKKSAFGPALTYSVTELAEGLMAANQHQLAFNLLKSAMEDEIISKSMMTLYADCADKIKDSNGLCNIYSQQGDALSEAV